MRSNDIPQLAINVFDKQYRKHGIQAQRLYPNESLIRFLAANYFSYPLAERRKIKILEIGCGSGANLWMLAKEGFSVYGLDGSSEALNLAKTELYNKWGVSAKLDLGSFIDLPYPDGHFDAVVDIVSLQHLDFDSSSKAFREVERVLKGGGGDFLVTGFQIIRLCIRLKTHLLMI